MPQCILFVDDDRELLAGLRRMLRPMHREWDMTFAQGGPAGVAALLASPYDVIVSDMRMPDIDGAELLRQAATIRPGAVRIMLSGHACYEASLRAVGAAHQCLSKPCDAATLRDSISRALALRDVVSCDEIVGAVSQMTSLPSRPGVYREMTAALQSSSPSIRTIGEIVARDLGMACKLLQVANSAFFSGQQRPIFSTRDAVESLGLDVIRNLALSTAAFAEFDCPDLLPIIDEFGRHSIESRDHAEGVAIDAGFARPQAEAAATAGLLRGVGQLVFAAIYGARYGQVLSRARESSAPLRHIERDELGASNVDAGAYLLGLWGLPGSIVDAVANFHRREERPDDAECSRALTPQEALTTGRLQA